MPISELSRRVGVGLDTLRVWERRYGLLNPRRTAGNIRLYSSVDEARVRLMKRHIRDHIPAAQAAELALAARLPIGQGRGGSVLEREAQRAAGELRAALERFDEAAGEQALQELLCEYSATAVIRDVLIPYLRQLGDRWAASHTGVAQEHFASNFLQARLLALARGWDRGLGPRVLLAGAPDDQHTLALISFGIALHQLGWRIVYLGAATPLEVLSETAEHVEPELIVISTSLTGSLTARATELQAVTQHWSVALAGMAADPDLAAACGAHVVKDDPVTAARSIAVGDFIRSRMGPPPAQG